MDETPKLYPCPLPGCHFELLSERPGPAENDMALAEVFGAGVFAAHARNERLRRIEDALRGHLSNHTVEEFAIALANANKRIAGLSGDQIVRWAEVRPGDLVLIDDCLITAKDVHVHPEPYGDNTTLPHVHIRHTLENGHDVESERHGDHLTAVRRQPVG